MSEGQDMDAVPSAPEGRNDDSASTEDSTENLEEGSDEDSSMSSESEEADSDDSSLQSHDILRFMIGEVTAPPAVDAAQSVPTPTTSLHCVACDRSKTNEPILTCKTGHSICGRCVQMPAEASFRALPRCPHCDEDAEPNPNNLFLKCQFCQAEYRNVDLKTHEANICDKRPVYCKYKIAGCTWSGFAAEQGKHEKECPLQNLSGEELLKALDANSKPQEMQIGRNDLMKLLSQTDCNLLNIRLVKKIAPTEETSATYYESPVFSAANLSWLAKAKVVERPNQPSIVEFALELISRVQRDTEYRVFYAAIGGPKELKPILWEHRFNAHSVMSSYQRLLEFGEQFKIFETAITFRLIMSLA